MHLQSQSQVIIDKSALLHNVAELKKICHPGRFAAVIKSNAYGHGLEECLQILMGQVDFFAVNTIAEYLEIRRLDPQTPVLVMGLNGQDLGELQSQSPEDLSNAHLVLSSKEAIEQALQIVPDLQFHVKIDTGLSRLGMPPAEFQNLLNWRREQKPGHWTGLMTHFANVEDVSDQDYANRQLQLFNELRQQALEIKSNLICHTAASAAAMLLPNARMDLVRIGIALYGLWPSSQTRLSFLSQHNFIPDLRPVLQWHTKIVHIHDVAAGASLGYGCARRVEQDSRVAVLPVGYYEGYDRLLSNQAYVLIRGRRAPVMGRVSMNMIIVDISLIEDASIQDRAVLLGHDGNESISAEQLAEWSQTINYEVVTRILPAIPRVIQ